MKSISEVMSDAKSRVINCYNRDKSLFKLSALGDTKTGIALPGSGRITPIAESKVAKDKEESYSRMKVDYNLWKATEALAAAHPNAKIDLG